MGEGPILETLVDGQPQLAPAERAAQIRAARLAALAEPEVPSPSQEIVKPVVWLTDKRAAMLEDKGT